MDILAKARKLESQLARTVDRARALEQSFTPIDHPQHARQVWELRQLDHRIRVVNAAILLCTASAVAPKLRRALAASMIAATAVS